MTIRAHVATFTKRRGDRNDYRVWTSGPWDPIALKREFFEPLFTRELERSASGRGEPPPVLLVGMAQLPSEPLPHLFAIKRGWQDESTYRDGWGRFVEYRVALLISFSDAIASQVDLDWLAPVVLDWQPSEPPAEPTQPTIELRVPSRETALANRARSIAHRDFEQLAGIVAATIDRPTAVVLAQSADPAAIRDRAALLADVAALLPFGARAGLQMSINASSPDVPERLGFFAQSGPQRLAIDPNGPIAAVARLGLGAQYVNRLVTARSMTGDLNGLLAFLAAQDTVIPQSQWQTLGDVIAPYVLPLEVAERLRVGKANLQDAEYAVDKRLGGPTTRNSALELLLKQGTRPQELGIVAANWDRSLASALVIRFTQLALSQPLPENLYRAIGDLAAREGILARCVTATLEVLAAQHSSITSENLRWCLHIDPWRSQPVSPETVKLFSGNGRVFVQILTFFAHLSSSENMEARQWLSLIHGAVKNDMGEVAALARVIGGELSIAVSPFAIRHLLATDRKSGRDLLDVALNSASPKDTVLAIAPALLGSIDRGAMQTDVIGWDRIIRLLQKANKPNSVAAARIDLLLGADTKSPKFLEIALSDQRHAPVYRREVNTLLKPLSLETRRQVTESLLPDLARLARNAPKSDSAILLNDLSAALTPAMAPLPSPERSAGAQQIPSPVDEWRSLVNRLEQIVNHAAPLLHLDEIERLNRLSASYSEVKRRRRLGG